MGTMHEAAERPPEKVRLTFLQWLRENLFNTWYNALMTLISLGLLAVVVPPTVRWILFGARWGVIWTNLRLFMVGRYPPAHLWRVETSLLLVALLFGLSAGAWEGTTLRRLAALFGAGFLLLALLPVSPATRLVLGGSGAAVFLGWRLARGRAGWQRPLLWAWYVHFFLSLFLYNGLPPQAPPFSTLSLSVLLALAGLGLGGTRGGLRALSALAAFLGLAFWALGRLGDLQGLGLGILLLVGAAALGWRRLWVPPTVRILWLAFGPLLFFNLLAPALFLIHPALYARAAATFAQVATTNWGGLLLTFLLAVVGIVASFPLGVLLGVGRHQGLPAIRLFSTLYIELIRGVPLVTVLFTAQVMLPLFLPEGVRVDNLIRAMTGITLFSAAYLAENVRGGLQSVPRGQVEAARALGLNGFQTLILIVLPQALRAVIPAIVGQFISLFKDTSLVTIVGLAELLGMALAVTNQPEWLGTQREAFLFVAVIYWIFSYSLSWASRRLETALGLGTR